MSAVQWRLGAVLVSSTLIVGSTRAAIIYVDDSAVRGLNNGTSWQDAYLDLHSGLNSAQPGDEIRIGQGMYKPNVPGGHRDASFQPRSGMIVQGGYAGLNAPGVDPDGLDPAIYITTLSGDLNGDDLPDFANYADNSYHVVTADAVDSTGVLRGVTITAGNANWPSYDDIDPRSVGGGLTCVNNATPTLADCVIRDNRSFAGGGGGFAPDGLHLADCTFLNNQVIVPASGGALWISNGQIVDCTFQGNYAEYPGGAIYGGATLRRCRFVDNDSNELGGALAGSFVAIDCDFINNWTAHGAGAFMGGNSTFINCRFLGNGSACHGAPGSAMFISGSGSVINCLFSGNQGSFAALAVDPDANTPVLIANCTFIGNSSAICPGAAVNAWGTQTSVVNCILWDNVYESTDSQGDQISAAPTTVLANNFVQGWDGTLGGTGNSSDDPLLIDPDGADDDYGTEDDNARLSDDSPCRDEGSNSFLPPDEFDVDEDGDTAEPLPLDLDLLPRVVNDLVDVGAYEHQGSACPADVEPAKSGDGQVNVDDLILVIGNWGPCGSTDCTADITNDGMVDIDDLLFVILHWGECP
jgi:predicted outer membrane repeat protein